MKPVFAGTTQPPCRNSPNNLTKNHNADRQDAAITMAQSIATPAIETPESWRISKTQVPENMQAIMVAAANVEKMK